MRVGILSDSHDKLGSSEDALALFLREEVGAILHLGDVCTPRILEPFKKTDLPMFGVFGNNDYDRFGLQKISTNGFCRGPRIVEVSGRKILMAHKFDDLQEDLNDGGRFDLVLFGHTHRPLTMRMGKIMVINPGEACGSMTGRPTCAVVDLATMDARILDLAGSAIELDEPGIEAGSHK